MPSRRGRRQQRNPVMRRYVNEDPFRNWVRDPSSNPELQRQADLMRRMREPVPLHPIQRDMPPPLPPQPQQQRPARPLTPMEMMVHALGPEAAHVQPSEHPNHPGEAADFAEWLATERRNELPPAMRSHPDNATPRDPEVWRSPERFPSQIGSYTRPLQQGDLAPERGLEPPSAADVGLPEPRPPRDYLTRDDEAWRNSILRVRRQIWDERLDRNRPMVAQARSQQPRMQQGAGYVDDRETAAREAQQRRDLALANEIAPVAHTPSWVLQPPLPRGYETGNLGWGVDVREGSGDGVAKRRRMGKQSTIMPPREVAAEQQRRLQLDRQGPSTPQIDPATGWPIDPVSGEPVAPLEWERRMAEEARRQAQQDRADERRTRYEPTSDGIRIRRRF